MHFTFYDGSYQFEKFLEIEQKALIITFKIFIKVIEKNFRFEKT